MEALKWLSACLPIIAAFWYADRCQQREHEKDMRRLYEIETEEREPRNGD